MQFKVPLVSCLAHYLTSQGSILPMNDNSCPTEGHARCPFQVSFKGNFPYGSKSLSDTLEGKDTYCIINIKQHLAQENTIRTTHEKNLGRHIGHTVWTRETGNKVFESSPGPRGHVLAPGIKFSGFFVAWSLVGYQICRGLAVDNSVLLQSTAINTEKDYS